MPSEIGTIDEEIKPEASSTDEDNSTETETESSGGLMKVLRMATTKVLWRAALPKDAKEDSEHTPVPVDQKMVPCADPAELDSTVGSAVRLAGTMSDSKMAILGTAEDETSSVT
jgi:hypothetical protein